VGEMGREESKEYSAYLFGCEVLEGNRAPPVNVFILVLR
jgi:hypothetical protein